MTSKKTAAESLGELCLFYAAHSCKYSAFCNQAEISVCVDGITFFNNEQYFLYMKAVLFHETDIAQSVLKCADRHEMKNIVFKSKNFDAVTWDEKVPLLADKCNYGKFLQHDDLKELLLATNDSFLAEASYDRVWGIGVNCSTGQNKERWSGRNEQGQSLMRVRMMLRTNTLPLEVQIVAAIPPSSSSSSSHEIADYSSSNQRAEFIDDEDLVDWRSLKDDFFVDTQILMKGDTWSLEKRMLHPKLRTSWQRAVMSVQLQTRPQLGMVWDGKPSRSNRNIGFFSPLSTSYEISKKMFPAVMPSKDLLTMLDAMNFHRNECFNAMIMNEYINSRQRIGYHSDNPIRLGRHGVDTLSFGETRICRFRTKALGQPGTIVLDVVCENGSLLSMMGTFQSNFTHEIIEEPSKKLNTRRSVTFRWMKSDEELAKFS